MTKDVLSTSKYILKEKTIDDHLSPTIDPISYQDLLIFIIGSLGSNYNYKSFITFMSMNEHKPSVSTLRGMLKAFDRMLGKHFRLEMNKVCQDH